MTAKIQHVESYYQTFINKGIYILPYAIAITFIIQLIIQKIKFYINAQWNQFIGFVMELLNCTIEDETENSLDSREEAYIANFNDDRCKIISSDTNSMYKVDPGLDSSSSATSCIQDFDDSVSDIEVLRGDDSDDETNNPKVGTIAEEILAKTKLLQKKRHELCGQLLSYKLMEFQIDTPLSPISNVPDPWESKSKSPLPFAEEINVQVPPTPTYESRPPPFMPEYEESYGFTCEDMLARAIQASLDDVAAKVALESNLIPPGEDSTFATVPGASSNFAKLPGESSHFAKLPEESSTKLARRRISADSPHSPGKMSQKQSTPTRAFMENNPHIHQPPVISFVDMWNKNYAPDVEKDVEKPVARQEVNENIVMEDFMEGDRYVGDKGKRPMSGRYAYKKRSKPSKPDSEEPGPSGSGDVPKKDSAAE